MILAGEVPGGNGGTLDLRFRCVSHREPFRLFARRQQTDGEKGECVVGVVHHAQCLQSLGIVVVIHGQVVGRHDVHRLRSGNIVRARRENARVCIPFAKRQARAAAQFIEASVKAGHRQLCEIGAGERNELLVNRYTAFELIVILAKRIDLGIRSVMDVGMEASGAGNRHVAAIQMAADSPRCPRAQDKLGRQFANQLFDDRDERQPRSVCLGVQLRLVKHDLHIADVDGEEVTQDAGLEGRVISRWPH